MYPPSSHSPEDEWLKKAIEQLKSGIPFIVSFIGKIELPTSIAEEPDGDNRVSIVSGCLRKVAHTAAILPDDGEISEVAENFLENAKIVIKNVEVQFSIYDNVFTIGDHITNKFYARHKIEDIAFAHIDPVNRDIIGYYALERKPGKPDARFYYVIQSECGIQILAAMKLAFTVFAEKQQFGDVEVDVSKVAECMTPSPTTPNGAYCLLRLSTPAEDGTGFVHQITPVDSDKLHQQVKIMALSERAESQFLQSDAMHSAATANIQNITNIYLNMEDFRRINPYSTSMMYPEISSDVVDIPQKLKPKKTKIVEIHERHENDEGFGGDEDEGREYATAPPLTRKPPNVLARMKQIYEETLRSGIQGASRQTFQQFRPSSYDTEIEKLKRKEREIQERIRQAETQHHQTLAPEIPQLPPRKKRKVVFKSIKDSFRFRAHKLALPLKKKLGNLRLTDLDESTMGSDYTSLNSQSFDGSITSASSEASSEDSGVHDDFFVFPEAPETSLHWTRRIFRRRENKLQLSLTQFARLSEYLDEQPWFHGTIHRLLAESRLVKDGEFLVRQSAVQPGQFIVSALRNRRPYHICVVNQHGQIRSHAGDFPSVIHLIQFHFQTQTPLCSKTTAMLLQKPVLRPLHPSYP